MKLKILVTGASGLVGSRFIELCSGNYDFITPEYPEFDLTKPETVLGILSKEKPDVVIHFAAYTNVGEAENQRGNKEGDCWRINVEGTKNLVDAVSPQTRFIHISTDMVFPGSNEAPGPYPEDAIPEENSDKVTWYGFSKGEAERIVREKFGDQTSILRLIYPFRAKYDAKPDYVRKPLSLFDEGKLYPMFTDQQVSITLVDELAKALSLIIDKNLKGVFHASSKDTTTPFELISYAIEKTRGVKDAVKPSSLDEFLKTAGNPVRYPKFGGLKVEKTEEAIGMKYKTWREMIDEFARQLKEL